MPKIFVSYRRHDKAVKALVVSLGEYLERSIGTGQVFVDREAIPPGVSWEQHLLQELATCSVMLVGIEEKDRWLGKSDNGSVRIEDPSDWIHREVLTGLTRGIPVIPLLFDKAEMPKQAELPQPLGAFARLERFVIHSDHMEYYCGQLVQKLNAHFFKSDAPSGHDLGDVVGVVVDDTTDETLGLAWACASHHLITSERIAAEVKHRRRRAHTITFLLGNEDPRAIRMAFMDSSHSMGFLQVSDPLGKEFCCVEQSTRNSSRYFAARVSDGSDQATPRIVSSPCSVVWESLQLHIKHSSEQIGLDGSPVIDDTGRVVGVASADSTENLSIVPITAGVLNEVLGHE